MKKLIVVIGLPGSGKDTQIELLQKTKNVEVVRVGDLIRAEAEKDSELKQALASGNLANNDKVNSLIVNEISTFPEDSVIISDGFPRRIAQAKWLEKYANENNIEIVKYLLIKITDDESMKRLLKRGREDDTEEIIAHRIAVFHNETNEVIEFYKNKNLFASVDGIGDVTEIQKRIKKELNW